MANLRDKFGGIGGLIRKALPYVATYFVGRKLGERGTRKQAEEEIAQQRERGAQNARDQIEGAGSGASSTGDYIRGKDV